MAKTVVLGVTGSIAAYRACEIISALKKISFNVKVVLTKEGAEFITPLTLATLSGNKVTTGMFELPTEWSPVHTALAEKADLVDAHDSKILGGALRKKGSKGLYQGSLRVKADESAIVDGRTREFGTPSTEIHPSWIKAGKDLEARYRSVEWNTRR